MAIQLPNLSIRCGSAPTVAQNLAIDEEAIQLTSIKGRASLRFWWGGPPAVVIGFSEKPDQTVNQNACRDLGIEVLKRFTGGGSVLQTAGVLNYSLTIPTNRIIDPQNAFQPGMDFLLDLIGSFGLVGATRGISDVAVEGRKVSGNAQAQRRGALLVHGTLLIDFDYELAEKALKHPLREPEYRRGRNHRDFLISLRELGISDNKFEIEQKAVAAARRVFCDYRVNEPSSEKLLLR
jgi:lipoate-protein ligase A